MTWGTECDAFDTLESELSFNSEYELSVESIKGIPRPVRAQLTSESVRCRQTATGPEAVLDGNSGLLHVGHV